MQTDDGEEIVEGAQEQDEAEELNLIPVQLDEEHETTYETIHLTTNSGNSSNNVRGKYYKQTYRQAWEHMPDFKGWLRAVTGEPTRAYCTYCQKTLHAHRLSLLKHTCTLRHQKAAQIHNARKNKVQNMNQEHDDDEEVHAIVIHENELTQEDLDQEDGAVIEYAEAASDTEEIEGEENEMSYELQVPFEKHAQVSQNYTGNKPPISTHIMDTSRGCSVSGLQVSLYKLIDGRWTYINEGITNSSGSFANFVEPTDFTSGRYKLHYDVDRYFEARKQETLYPFIEIIFDCRTTTETFHVPLLLSPFGYTTYRES